MNVRTSKMNMKYAYLIQTMKRQENEFKAKVKIQNFQHIKYFTGYKYGSKCQQYWGHVRSMYVYTLSNGLNSWWIIKM